jgi:hypothetical protein
LKGKKKYNQNMTSNKDDSLGYIRYYDDIFDYELGTTMHTCAVLKFQSLSLAEFAKDGIEKSVCFILCQFFSFF